MENEKDESKFVPEIRRAAKILGFIKEGIDDPGDLMHPSYAKGVSNMISQALDLLKRATIG